MERVDLTSGQRLAVARLSGEVSRSTRGGLRHLSRAEKLWRIRQITTDPCVLGHVMGPLLAPEHPEYAAADAEALELLRAAGADEGEGERDAARIRQQRNRLLLGRYADEA